jgi:hypothetical protein
VEQVGVEAAEEIEGEEQPEPREDDGELEVHEAQRPQRSAVFAYTEPPHRNQEQQLEQGRDQGDPQIRTELSRPLKNSPPQSPDCPDSLSFCSPV